MRLVLYLFAVVAGLALAVIALVAGLPVATLIFGLLIAVVGVAGLVLRSRRWSIHPPVDRPPSTKGGATPGGADRGPSTRGGAASGGAALDRGAALESSGDLDGALAAYQEAAEADDERVAPVGHLRIGTVLARRNELPAAEEHARLALGYPAGRHTVAATILLASVAMRAGKTDLAKAAVAELAAADDPAHAAAGRSYQAMFAIADGDVTEANLATLRTATNAGDQLTGAFLEMIQQATKATAKPRPESETGEG